MEGQPLKGFIAQTEYTECAKDKLENCSCKQYE